MIELNITTGRVLRYGITVGLMILLVGMIASAMSSDISEIILKAGIAVVIFTPLASIFVSALALYVEKSISCLRANLIYLPQMHVTIRMSISCLRANLIYLPQMHVIPRMSSSCLRANLICLPQMHVTPRMSSSCLRAN